MSFSLANILFQIIGFFRLIRAKIPADFSAGYPDLLVNRDILHRKDFAGIGHGKTLFMTGGKAIVGNNVPPVRVSEKKRRVAAGDYLLFPSPLAAYFFMKRSTRPAVSTIFCFPVMNG